VVFVDNNKKFVSTSDDKKVFLWEFGIPVVVKHVSDPEQLAISQTALHPNGKYFVGQASDNKVFFLVSRLNTFRSIAMMPRVAVSGRIRRRSLQGI
jgi:pre-mRNA-processing factor 17